MYMLFEALRFIGIAAAVLFFFWLIGNSFSN